MKSFLHDEVKNPHTTAHAANQLRPGPCLVTLPVRLLPSSWPWERWRRALGLHLEATWTWASHSLGLGFMCVKGIIIFISHIHQCKGSRWQINGSCKSNHLVLWSSTLPHIRITCRTYKNTTPRPRSVKSESLRVKSKNNFFFLLKLNPLSRRLMGSQGCNLLDLIK